MLFCEHFHTLSICRTNSLNFCKDFICIVLERGVGERETSIQKRNIDWLSLIPAPTWEPTCNPGTCLAWKLNQQPFSLQDDTQATAPHQGQTPTSGFLMASLCFKTVQINSLHHAILILSSQIRYTNTFTMFCNYFF